MTRFFLFALLVLISCSDRYSWNKAKVQNAEFLHRTMKEITDRMVYDVFSPPVASRIYSYVSIAGYEVMIHQDKNYKSLSGQLNGLEPMPQPEPGIEYCYPLAATTAMLKVGQSMIFTEDELAKFQAKIVSEFKDARVPDDVYKRSIAFGDSIAKHVLQWSAKDKYKQSRSFPKYFVEKTPGTWKPTPPAYMDAIEPHWNKIRTFVIDSAEQFRPVSPTAFSVEKSSQFYKEAYEVYEIGKKLNDEQRAVASFWDCNPFMVNVKGHLTFGTKKISPGGHWINIARVACHKTNASMMKTAETYALLSLALADGFISCWDEKFRSKLVRPETYINQNIDQRWTPLLQTPPFPEYTSGHSVISAASAVMLTKLFGDNFNYTDSTEVEFGLTPRNFKSFKEAADEAAVSRMYGGIHYKPACENGKLQGRAIAEFILSNVQTQIESKPN